MRKQKSRKSVVGLSCAASLGLLAASQAQAGVIFSDGFETSAGYTQGSMPSYVGLTGSGNFLAAQPNGVTQNVSGGWYANFGNDGYVIANPSTTATPTSGVANTSANVAALVGDSSGGLVVSSTIAQNLGTLNTSGDLTVTQMAYYPTTGAAGTGISTNRELLIGDYSAGGFPELVFGEGGYWNNGSGSLVWELGQNSGIESPALTTNAWHSATEVFHFNQSDLTDSTIDFSVDGVTVENGIPFDATALLGSGFVYAAYTDDYPTQSNAGAILLDNVVVTGAIPEPASLSLLAIGAGSLLARRRQAKK